ncbi:MAG TPA: class I SAM-dependent methyltransferase [Ktedonobacteraceae bacterium]|nr:class I SAM-dependent methyltransferase [Ktedonobacteraceae bacterium]
MSTREPRREHPSTYWVQDRSNEEEMTRLQLQDQLVTAGMGGVLPEQPDPTIFKRVLDVGCGTGGWLIEAAKTYPSMTLLVGVDVSSKMLDYARAQATAQHVDDRVQFAAMDALRMLEFPAGYFDLVNQRFGWSYLRTWDWPKLLQEYQRITRIGGIIRVTECEINESNSPTFNSLNELLLQALYQAGHFFTLDRRGVINELPRLLKQYGLRDVQTKEHDLVYRAGTPEGHLFYEDIRHAYRTFVPFLRKWARVPDDYETIYQKLLDEMQQPDFVTTWRLLTIWGTKS